MLILDAFCEIEFLPIIHASSAGSRPPSTGGSLLNVVPLPCFVINQPLLHPLLGLRKVRGWNVRWRHTSSPPPLPRLPFLVEEGRGESTVDASGGDRHLLPEGPIQSDVCWPTASMHRNKHALKHACGSQSVSQSCLWHWSRFSASLHGPVPIGGKSLQRSERWHGERHSGAWEGVGEKVGLNLVGLNSTGFETLYCIGRPNMRLLYFALATVASWGYSQS